MCVRFKKKLALKKIPSKKYTTYILCYLVKQSF